MLLSLNQPPTFSCKLQADAAAAAYFFFSWATSLDGPGHAAIASSIHGCFDVGCWRQIRHPHFRCHLTSPAKEEICVDIIEGSKAVGTGHWALASSVVIFWQQKSSRLQLCTFPPWSPDRPPSLNRRRDDRPASQSCDGKSKHGCGVECQLKSAGMSRLSSNIRFFWNLGCDLETVIFGICSSIAFVSSETTDASAAWAFFEAREPVVLRNSIADDVCRLS